MKVGKLYLLINRNRDYRNVFWLVEKRNKKKKTKFYTLKLRRSRLLHLKLRNHKLFDTINKLEEVLDF